LPEVSKISSATVSVNPSALLSTAMDRVSISRGDAQCFGNFLVWPLFDQCQRSPQLWWKVGGTLALFPGEAARRSRGLATVATADCREGQFQVLRS
jgi:hypothetical protein